MYKPKWILLLGCFSLVACTSTQQTPATAAATNAAPATVAVVKSYDKNTAKNAVICRKEKTLGSNRSVKVCKTVAQQEQEQKDAQRMVNDRTLQQSMGNGG